MSSTDRQDNSATIELCIDSKPMIVANADQCQAEEIIIKLCKKIEIGPLARHLFGLRISSDQKDKYWLPLNAYLSNCHYEFRIRFKVANLMKLKKTDLKAYDYYFHQARHDVRSYKITDMNYDLIKRELIGLGVADMYRVMIEKDLSIDAVLNDYKKFISKEVIKRHKFFIIKPVRESLKAIMKRGHDAWFVKGEYLKGLELMAPEYLIEEYYGVIDKDGAPHRVCIRISPFNKEFPGIRYCSARNALNPSKENKEWELLSSIEDLCFILISKEGAVQIPRKTGIPTYLKLDSPLATNSFVSCLDGYYRLMVKWTFNLCKEITTPTLKRLHELKCHGPVGGEFSYAKLEEKRQNHRGCYILRECDLKYNVFYIDICTKTNVKPKTFKLEKINDEEYIFNDDVTRYKSITELRKAYSKPDNLIFLNECLAPSEYDKSPLLLCLPDSLCSEPVMDGNIEVADIGTYPLAIHSSKLQIYKGQLKESTNGAVLVYRSLWKTPKDKKMEVALKVLKQKDHGDKHLKEFMQRAGEWAGLQQGAKGIVRLWGISLSNPTALVLEYAKLGALPDYLRENKTSMHPIDFLEAASHLAAALFHMEEHNYVHGKIRCHKLLVFSHDENNFTVKLTDRGIHIPYTQNDVHWLPPEYYINFELAKNSQSADIWAFATTVWEIYMEGEKMFFSDNLDPMELYTTGSRLGQPAKCPNTIYKILKECWHGDPHHRKKPQAIMRDINQLLLIELGDSRRRRPYETLFTKPYSGTASLASSGYTQNTTLLSEEQISVDEAEESDCFTGWSGSTMIAQNFANFENNERADADLTFLSPFINRSYSYDDIDALQTIFELDLNLHVVLQGRIGQGFYGEVYKATLDTKDGEQRIVAVKRLKVNAVANFSDFEREISIMRKLQHPNIVQILTSLEVEQYLIIMEYVPHGSLQTYLKINRETITHEQLLNYALGIARGMEYLAQKHIVHRDLAARNILVVDDNHVKISDFGLAQVVGKNEYYILKTNRELPIKWYAPESLRDGKFSTKSDVWSYGVTLFEMFSFGEEPVLLMMNGSCEGVQQQQNILDALENGTRLPCPAMCPQSVYARIMYPCWKGLPNDRPNFTELCEDILDLLS